ncbi:MAG: helix-turn-helix domain-containing protein [Ilumatobacter sp.]|uniref:helix-turn-helix domain-containing protein n=1 Tax=Ilumatobacter sp. TaxID=1967498 RepID=UPI00391CA439
MPRATPSDRLPKLLDAAAGAFVEHGFHRTQMDDIAERLGVSKGTVYRAVDSKEALFAAVIEWADDPDGIPATGIDASSDVALVAGRVAGDLATAVAALELTSIVGGRKRLGAVDGFGVEVERITSGLFGVMRNRRTSVMVLDRCAGEIPELGAVWFGDGRYALVDLWHGYLELRSKQMAAKVDHSILARTIVEIITIWAVKMPWDPAPRPYPDDTSTACATMVRNLVTGVPR